jgi:uncharacterized protein
VSFDDVVQKIALALEPERIYLFGSRARGDFTATSDYDVLVVVADTPRSTLHLAGEALWAARGKGFGLDVVVYTQSEFEYSQSERHDVVFHAMKDAKVVYAKSDP